MNANKFSRDPLEARWLALTKVTLPEVASERGWPVRFDHRCARILLDDAWGGAWYDRIERHPACRHASDDILAAAVALGEAARAGTADPAALNGRSLGHRRARRGGRVPLARQAWPSSVASRARAPPGPALRQCARRRATPGHH